MLLLGAGLLMGNAPATLAAGIEGLMHAFAQIHASRARFEETRHLAALSVPVTLRGELEFVAPDYLVKRIEVPVRERYVMRHDTLTIERDGETGRTLDLDTHPVLRSMSEAFRATLAGDLPVLQRHFKLAFSEDGQGGWTLELTPIDARVAEHVERLIFKGKGAALLEASTIETGGDRSDMRITPP